MSLARRVSLGITIALLSVCAAAADLPRAKPESAGLSSSRLERIGEVFRAKVDAGEIPGNVALVARRGKVAIPRNLVAAPQSRFRACMT